MKSDESQLWALHAARRQQLLNLVGVLRPILRHLNRQYPPFGPPPADRTFAVWFDRRLPGVRRHMAEGEGLDDGQLIDHLTSGLPEVNVRTSAGSVEITDASRADVRAATGDVSVGRTEDLLVVSQTGDVTIADFGGTGRIDTTTGAIDVHATRSGDIRAGTATGPIRISAHPEVAGRLAVYTEIATGNVQILRRAHDSLRRHIIGGECRTRPHG